MSPSTSPQKAQEPSTTPPAAADKETTAMSSKVILHKLQTISTPQTMATAVRIYLIRHGETNWNLKGKIQGGGYDVPLNENGKEQALKAAKALEGISFDAVASSSLSRAKETADIVYDYYNKHNNNNNSSSKKPLRIVDPGFNEMRFGKFEGFSGRTKENEGTDNKASTSEEELFVKHFFEVKANVWKDQEYPFLSRDSSDPIHPEDEVYRVDCELSGKGESTKMVVDRSIKALSETISRVLEENDEENRTKHVAIVSHGRTNKVLMGAMLDEVNAKTIGQSNANISVLDHPGWGKDGVDAKGGWIARFINSTDHVKGTTIER